jgi:hypothetical protein
MATQPQQLACCLEYERPRWLKAAFFIGEQNFGSVLLPYLVFDYKDKPNKKKAIFIYDKCIFDANALGLGGDAPDTLDLHSVRDVVKPSADLENSIADVKAKRAQAIGMSWFQRLWTSADRKAADIGLGTNMFDELLWAHLDPLGKDNPWADFVTNDKITNVQAPLSSDIYKPMKRRLPRTCDEIAAAGFSLEATGLKGLRAALP